MWTFLVENRLLYDVERLTLQKYTEDAPFTNTFSNASPGKNRSMVRMENCTIIYGEKILT
jgi:hypothetical protein